MRKATLILSAAILAACSSLVAPAGPPAVDGVIAARDQSIPTGEPPSMLVKKGGDECGVVFLVRESTPIHRLMADGSMRSASLRELTLGTRVRVWADVVMDSCPGQAAATAVEIID